MDPTSMLFSGQIQPPGKWISVPVEGLFNGSGEEESGIRFGNTLPEASEAQNPPASPALSLSFLSHQHTIVEYWPSIEREWLIAQSMHQSCPYRLFEARLEEMMRAYVLNSATGVDILGKIFLARLEANGGDVVCALDKQAATEVQKKTLLWQRSMDHYAINCQPQSPHWREFTQKYLGLSFAIEADKRAYNILSQIQQWPKDYRLADFGGLLKNACYCSSRISPEKASPGWTEKEYDNIVKNYKEHGFSNGRYQEGYLTALLKRYPLDNPEAALKAAAAINEYKFNSLLEEAWYSTPWDLMNCDELPSCALLGDVFQKNLNRAELIRYICYFLISKAQLHLNCTKHADSRLRVFFKEGAQLIFRMLKHVKNKQAEQTPEFPAWEQCEKELLSCCMYFLRDFRNSDNSFVDMKELFRKVYANEFIEEPCLEKLLRKDEVNASLMEVKLALMRMMNIDHTPVKKPALPSTNLQASQQLIQIIKSISSSDVLLREGDSIGDPGNLQKITQQIQNVAIEPATFEEVQRAFTELSFNPVYGESHSFLERYFPNIFSAAYLGNDEAVMQQYSRLLFRVSRTMQGHEPLARKLLEYVTSVLKMKTEDSISLVFLAGAHCGGVKNDKVLFNAGADSITFEYERDPELVEAVSALFSHSSLLITRTDGSCDFDNKYFEQLLVLSHTSLRLHEKLCERMIAAVPRVKQDLRRWVMQLMDRQIRLFSPLTMNETCHLLSGLIKECMKKYGTRFPPAGFDEMIAEIYRRYLYTPSFSTHLVLDDPLIITADNAQALSKAGLPARLCVLLGKLKTHGCDKAKKAEIIETLTKWFPNEYRHLRLLHGELDIEETLGSEDCSLSLDASLEVNSASSIYLHEANQEFEKALVNSPGTAYQGFEGRLDSLMIACSHSPAIGAYVVGRLFMNRMEAHGGDFAAGIVQSHVNPAIESITEWNKYILSYLFMPLQNFDTWGQVAYKYFSLRFRVDHEDVVLKELSNIFLELPKGQCPFDSNLLHYMSISLQRERSTSELKGSYVRLKEIYLRDCRVDGNLQIEHLLTTLLRQNLDSAFNVALDSAADILSYKFVYNRTRGVHLLPHSKDLQAVLQKNQMDPKSYLSFTRYIAQAIRFDLFFKLQTIGLERVQSICREYAELLVDTLKKMKSSEMNVGDRETAQCMQDCECFILASFVVLFEGLNEVSNLSLDVQPSEIEIRAFCVHMQAVIKGLFAAKFSKQASGKGKKKAYDPLREYLNISTANDTVDGLKKKLKVFLLDGIFPKPALPEKAKRRKAATTKSKTAEKVASTTAEEALATLTEYLNERKYLIDIAPLHAYAPSLKSLFTSAACNVVGDEQVRILEAMFLLACNCPQLAEGFWYAVEPLWVLFQQEASADKKNWAIAPFISALAVMRKKYVFREMLEGMPHGAFKEIIQNPIGLEALSYLIEKTPLCSKIGHAGNVVYSFYETYVKKVLPLVVQAPALLQALIARVHKEESLRGDLLLGFFSGAQLEALVKAELSFFGLGSLSESRYGIYELVYRRREHCEEFAVAQYDDLFLRCLSRRGAAVVVKEFGWNVLTEKNAAKLSAEGYPAMMLLSTSNDKDKADTSIENALFEYLPEDCERIKAVLPKDEETLRKETLEFHRQMAAGYIKGLTEKIDCVEKCIANCGETPSHLVRVSGIDLIDPYRNKLALYKEQLLAIKTLYLKQLQVENVSSDDILDYIRALKEYYDQCLSAEVELQQQERLQQEMAARILEEAKRKKDQLEASITEVRSWLQGNVNAYCDEAGHIGAQARGVYRNGIDQIETFEGRLVERFHEPTSILLSELEGLKNDLQTSIERIGKGGLIDTRAGKKLTDLHQRSISSLSEENAQLRSANAGQAKKIRNQQTEIERQAREIEKLKAQLLQASSSNHTEPQNQGRLPLSESRRIIPQKIALLREAGVEAIKCADAVEAAFGSVQAERSNASLAALSEAVGMEWRGKKGSHRQLETSDKEGKSTPGGHATLLAKKGLPCDKAERDLLDSVVRVLDWEYAALKGSASSSSSSQS